MKKFFLIFLTTIFCLSNFSSQAEIISIRNNEEKFGEWGLYCEIDDMMNTSHCKIASKFYKQTAVLSIEPTPKFLNQLVLAIPQIKPGSFVKIRIDEKNLILSNTVKKEDFGLIPLSQDQKREILQEIINGKNLYFRFETIDSDKEITAKLNLTDFKKALDYYKKSLNQK